MSLVNNSSSNPSKNLSPVSSIMNDSDASRYALTPPKPHRINLQLFVFVSFTCSFSFKDSNYSYDPKQPSDENTNLSFSISQ